MYYIFVCMYDYVYMYVRMCVYKAAFISVFLCMNKINCMYECVYQCGLQCSRGQWVAGVVSLLELCGWVVHKGRPYIHTSKFFCKCNWVRT